MPRFFEISPLREPLKKNRVHIITEPSIHSPFVESSSTLRLILVETEGTANLGAIARTAAAFGLSELRLVAPRCKIDEETEKWARYGTRVLERIEVFADLPTALADVSFAAAMSRRSGRDRYRHYALPVFHQDVFPQFASSVRQCAVVFGNEKRGLARHHLRACHCSVEIPVLTDDGSLNLAHSVSITLYELLGRPSGLTQSLPDRPREDEKDRNPGQGKASSLQLQALIKRCEHLLRQVGYPKHGASFEEEMVKLQAVVLRGGLRQWEHRLLLSMIAQIQYTLDNSV